LPTREVFITGASGFIGERLGRFLAARGDRLRCLVRSPAAARRVEAFGALPIQGEITDDIALERGLTGADLAFHLAGMYDIGIVDRATMERVNVDGTQAFLRGAVHAKVPRLIYASSTVALGPAEDGEGDESSEYRGPFPTEYHRTKTEAHALAREAQRKGLPLIIVCPAVAYGPGDESPNGRFMADLLRHRVPGFLSRSAWFSYVHVDDVVAGFVAAADRGTPGSTYVLSGEHMALDEFARRVAEAGGTTAPKMRFPAGVARLGGTVLDAATRLTGKRFQLNRENVEMTNGHRWVHSHARTSAELDWHPRPLAEGLPETVAWLKASIR
jgi:dihydroflavonol-4-reductase